MRKLVSRKDLSSIATERRGDAVSVTQLRKNERRWGLNAARLPDLNSRVVRFDLPKALDALAKAGVIPA